MREDVRALRERGFRILEVADEREARNALPMNVIALRPGNVLMPAGGAMLRAAYEAAGVECVEVEAGKFIKAGGGIHCMTGFLRRDDPV